VAARSDDEITAKLEVAQLWAAWAEKATPKVVPVISFGAKTDLGRVRDNNEDKYEFFLADDPRVAATKGSFFAVADGMGGHTAGQIASELTLKSVIKNYYADLSPDVPVSLGSAVESANSLIFDMSQAIPDRRGMGTTISAAVVRESMLYLAQVGDSRIYRDRNGVLEQLTQDHSWVEEQVARGTMTHEEARSSPFKNLITRSIGTQPQVEVDTFEHELAPGDQILLCSDGLTTMVDDGRIAKILKEASGPSMAASMLAEQANLNGGNDNITAVVVTIVDLQPWDEATKPKSEHRGSILSFLKR
jgi:serine/threonine protein phosphatase PrpC